MTYVELNGNAWGSHAASGVGAISRSSGPGRGVNPSQPRLIPAQRIGFFWIAVRPQPTTIEQLRDSLSQRPRQARNFIIVWSQQGLKLRTIVLRISGSKWGRPVYRRPLLSHNCGLCKVPWTLRATSEDEKGDPLLFIVWPLLTESIPPLQIRIAKRKGRA